MCLHQGLYDTASRAEYHPEKYAAQRPDFQLVITKKAAARRGRIVRRSHPGNRLFGEADFLVGHNDKISCTEAGFFVGHTQKIGCSKADFKLVLPRKQAARRPTFQLVLPRKSAAQRPVFYSVTARRYVARITYKVAQINQHRGNYE